MRVISATKVRNKEMDQFPNELYIQLYNIKHK